MANSYTQIFIQLIFATKGRESVVQEAVRVPIQKYIGGIIKAKKSKPLAIYCNPDHTHILLSLHPTLSVSEIARTIKSNSSKWINEKKLTPAVFSWQEGYGAFSYAKESVPSVIKYIENQKEHHKKKTFREEYLELLTEFGIDWDEKYLFLWG